ncbi:hypothetical protein SLS64_007975 [Diaporthe eres]
MPVAFVAAYEKGSNVDKDYYVNKHIPLVTSTSTSLDENDPYEAVFQAVFESKDALEKSLKDLGEEKNATFYEDAKKFSTKEPKVYHMEIRATSS